MSKVRFLMSTAIIIAATCLNSIFMNLDAQILRVAFVGDPQVDNERELDFARKSVYRDLANNTNLDFAIFMGDLVNDKPGLLRQSKAILDSLPFPCFVVPGNHDFDDYGGHSKPRDLKTFNEVIGPSDTAFVVGKYRFVLMNNVRITDIRKYEGGFSESQKSWLDSLVWESSKDGCKIVLCTHIPLSHSKGLDSLSAILSPKADYILVSGHTHSVRRHNFITSDGRQIPELIVGAACGSWWRGVKGPDGIPYSLQNCGAPRGYFMAEMGRRGIKLSYTTIDKLSYVSGKEAVSAHNYGDSLLVLNVFGGSEDGIAKVRSKFTKSVLMQRCEITAPEVEKEILRNASASREERRKNKNDFIPLRRKKSPHIWTVNCHFAADSSSLCRPNKNSSRIKVVYSDPMMKFRENVFVQQF